MSDPGPTRRLCNYLASVDYEDLPTHIVERSRYLLLDGVACGLVAAQLPWSQRAVAGTLAVDGAGDATLWGWERQTTALSAALLNGTFVQGFELDDFHPHGALHSSSVVVPAALAAAETMGGLDFERFLTALVLGYETGPRVGIALGGARVTVRGWHSGAVFGPLAAAAAAAKVYDLDSDGFESALGNAATRAGALMAAQYKSMVKRMHHGMASSAGLHGAALAKAGFIGIEDVIEQPYGGLASTMLGEEPDDIGRVSRGLGEEWTMLDIGIKRHACLIMLHSAVDALISLRERPGYAAADIASLKIGVSESVFKRTSWKLERPGTSLGSQMNLHFAAAVALIDGAAYVEQFAPASLARQGVWDLMDRIEVYHSAAIDELGRDRRFVTHIDIATVAGDSIRLVGQPPQDRPFSADDVTGKYRGLLANIVAPDRIDAIEKLILGADAQTDVRELADLLAGVVLSPFASAAGAAE